MHPIKRFAFSSILGWSSTRYNEFSLCKRRYFYQYYAKFDEEYPRNRIQALKEMVSVPLAIGSIAHEMITVLLRRLRDREKPIDVERFNEYIQEQCREYISVKVFREVYFGSMDRVDDAQIIGDVERAMDNLLESNRFDWISGQEKSDRSGWVIEPPGYGETRIDGMKAYCKVDFLFPVDEFIYIFDWKTGKEDRFKHERQLVGYAAWASYHFEIEPNLIRPFIAYLLPEYAEIDLHVEPFDVSAFAERVRVETEEMYEFCENVDRNIPLPKHSFPLTEQRSICDYCNFYELCFGEE